MTSFRIRPRFKINSNYSCEEIRTRIEQKLASEPHDCYVVIADRHIFLKVKPEEQHYWSPQLDLTCDSNENGTVIRGLYGPNPHVWTLFMFCYLAIATIAVFLGMFGLARFSLGMSAWVLWTLPGLALLALILYVSSQMGQKIGAEQTFMLHHFLEEVLDERIHMK